MTFIKPLLIACLTLASLFIASAMNCRTVSTLSDTIGQQLAISQAAAENGQWSEAEYALLQAGELWHSHNTYLHITVNHAEIDEAETLFAQMQEYAQQQETQLSAGIEAELASYIWDKAQALGLDCQVSVTVESGEDGVPLPRSVTVTGTYSEELSQIIETDLGIPRDHQNWQEAS